MKWKYGILALIVIMSLLPGEPALAKGASYKKIIHGGHVFDTVWIDLNDPRVAITVQVPGGFPLAGEKFESMVGNSRPTAAITGTYFNMSSHVPVGDIVMFGQLIHYGGIGTAMAVTRDNKVVFRRVPTGYVIHWDKFETVLAAGPTLLSNGEVDVHPDMENFSDKRIFGPAVRCAVGWRADNVLILLASRGVVSLKDLALAFKHMNCQSAMNLDGGSSTALYCSGTFYKKPRRELTNLLLVFDSPQAYNSYRKSSAYCFYRTGERFRARGKAFQAMLNFRGAAAADPTSAGYFKDLAGEYSSLGWNLWSSWSLSKAAAIYDKKGFADKALYYYGKALLVSDENASAHQWMADYYERAGDEAHHAIEKKAFSRCGFSSIALKQDLFSPYQQKLWYAFSWEDKGDGWLNEKTYGIKMKMPPDWEITHSRPYFIMLQNKNPQDTSFMSFEAIKSEIFTDLESTVSLMREKRGGETVSSEKSEISGFPACREVLSRISIDDKPWKLITTYVKRSRWVFVMTVGAPEENFSHAQAASAALLDNFSLETQFESYL